MRAKVKSRLLLAACVLALGLPTWAQGQSAPTDLGDKEFTSQDIVRALAPGVAPTPARRKRGLGVVAAEPASSSVEPVRRSVSIELQFEFDSSRLTRAALEKLDVVGAALRSPELSSGKFLISGHTDATGRYEYNLSLSKRRAEAVRDYLVSRYRVEADHLITVGKASDELIDPSRPDSAANRRVQLDALN